MRRWLALAVVCAACTDGASSSLGLGDLLYVDGAQYRPGAFPAATGGPDVIATQTTHFTIVIGSHDEPIRLVLGPDARAAIIGTPGANGAWIVQAGPPDFDTPDDPDVHTKIGLGDRVQPGPFELDAAAVDENGRIGERMAANVMTVADLPPDGDLVFALDWLGSADLDLHVIDPTGSEVWQGHPNSWQHPAPGDPVDPCAWASGGILDHDANAACAADGHTSEHVVWTPRMCNLMQVAPIIPAGTYTVRVEARDACGVPSTAWSASVFVAGELAASARGIATDYEATYGPHGVGAGTTAFTFTR